MAAFVGIEPDVAQQELFDVPPHGDLDEQLPVDAAAGANLADWYAFTSELLEALRAEARPQDDVSPVRIWPEHFDAAIDLGEQAAGRRGTYGGSPGDRHHDQPYLYASPWAGRIDEFFADPTFVGASLTHAEILAGADYGRLPARGAAPDHVAVSRGRCRFVQPSAQVVVRREGVTRSGSDPKLARDGV